MINANDVLCASYILDSFTYGKIIGRNNYPSYRD